jgi:hypothetical protein
LNHPFRRDQKSTAILKVSTTAFDGIPIYFSSEIEFLKQLKIKIQPKRKFLFQTNLEWDDKSIAILFENLLPSGGYQNNSFTQNL